VGGVESGEGGYVECCGRAGGLDCIELGRYARHGRGKRGKEGELFVQKLFAVKNIMYDVKR
jgi:hypothetical protein